MYPEGESADSLGLSGEEEFTITGLAEPLNAGELPREVSVQAGDTEFQARVRIDTPKEAEYFRHGGILQYVLRSLAAS
jgi:aconitate hydratase